jgi:chromosome segregation protein
MYLKSIELVGFKSFAKKSTLEFGSPITAIVGPNGSGKSNIAEAFRFVLGEQSIKSMRGKRGEDLIWSGSHDSSRANRASVKITLDNNNRTFTIDFPEVSLERVVNRDGTNEYLLNGSAVRLKDIHELLAGAYLGSSGHHIISQGEADRILVATPRDRRAIIEDALGLKLFQYKRIESEKKLEKTRDNISQVELLRREIAPHLRFLKKQVDKLERVMVEKQELLYLSLEYFYNENLFIKNEDRIIDDERGLIENGLKKILVEREETKSILQKIAQEDKKEYLVLEIEKELSSKRASKESLVREYGKVEGALEAEERIIKRESDVTTSDEHKTIKLKEVEELYEEISNLTLVEKIIERIRGFISERKRQSDSRTIIDAETRIQGLQVDKLKIERSIKALEDEERELEKKYEGLKKEMNKVKDSSHEAEKAMFKIMSAENELIAKKKLLEARDEQLKLIRIEFKRELEEVGFLVGPEVLKYGEKREGHSLSIHNQKTEKPESVILSRHLQDEHKRQIQKLKIRLEDSGVSGSDEIVKEYKDTSERDKFLERELGDLWKSAESLQKLIDDLGERLALEFKTGLQKINREFNLLFHEMFDGGEASLVLVKEIERRSSLNENEERLGLEEPEKVEEGLDISVSLPRKKIRSLMMLSGGERALTSIALIFAVSQVNPPPFIILDETDAALDESNSKKYGDMIERLSKQSQLILITHNRETMSRAGMIYGVTMGSSGISKLLSIKFDEAMKVAK